MSRDQAALDAGLLERCTGGGPEPLPQLDMLDELSGQGRLPV
jgi:hypothetical protein